MTVRQLARELAAIKEELQDKEVKVYYPNGNMGSFEIKFAPKDPLHLSSTKFLFLDKTDENIDYIILI